MGAQFTSFATGGGGGAVVAAGEYTGDGNSGRYLNIGLNPDDYSSWWLFVNRESGGREIWKHSDMGDTESYYLTAQARGTLHFTALYSLGFRLTDDSSINYNGYIFNYFFVGYP